MCHQVKGSQVRQVLRPGAKCQDIVKWEDIVKCEGSRVRQEMAAKCSIVSRPWAECQEDFVKCKDIVKWQGQQEVSEEEEKIGKFFKDVFKDGDMIINKDECEPEPQKKEPTGISKTDTEELEGLINKQKEEQKKAGNMDVRLSESAGTQEQRSEANRIL